MFGFYHTMEGYNGDKDLQRLLEQYRKTLNYPIEGIVLDNDFLYQYQSLSMDNAKFNHAIATLDLLNSFNMTVMHIMKSGFSKLDIDAPYLKYMDSNKCTIMKNW